MDAVKKIVSEPGESSPADYSRRVHRLAALYPTIFVLALAGEILLFARGRLFVSLAQRSNVETLVLAFFAVFFLYVGVLAAKGVPGSLRVAGFALLARRSGREEADRRTCAALGAPGDGPQGALNVVLEAEGAPGEPLELPVADERGPMGRILVDGVRVHHLDAYGGGSSSLLACLARQVTEIAGGRTGREVDVVEWTSLDDDAVEQYACTAEFGRNLSRALGKGPLWPTVALRPVEREELARRLSAICPALRREALLPHWEYAAEHKLPIIPEPLGIVSLSRSERRSDPVTTLAALAAVVALAVALLGGFVLFPPWVPGR